VRLKGEVVEVRRTGDSVLLIPFPEPWRALVESLGQFSEDFMEEGRLQPPAQERADVFP
jgi:antitoxin VapB